MPTPSRALAVLVALLLAAGIVAAPASAEPLITITFVRHAESEGNASGVIDTSVPGPPITPKGEQQAKEAAALLSRTPHDGVYASSMIRTQQTAQPLADDLGAQIAVLPGLREIEAGEFEGHSEADAISGYLQPMQQWLAGNRFARIPGSIDGNEFDARFDDAVDAIYRSGQQHPVAFSHGGAISLWTMMNVRNPRPELVESQPLPNTGHVIVAGNPVDGWTLIDWNGTKVE
jgi:broad specificity phosphatase PhoE